MRIRVLGSSAGGGFPQWNCNCPNCDGFRRGTLKAHARTQSSIAISADGSDWLLVNASPDILTQIQRTPALQPGRAQRGSFGPPPQKPNAGLSLAVQALLRQAR